MDIQVFVFDFDGTLIDSNQLKKDAFYTLFPDTPRHRDIITDVLNQHYERPRREILRHIFNALDLEPDPQKIEKIALQFGEQVLTGACNTPDMPGAKQALDTLSQTHRLYVSSGTPQDALEHIIDHRNWRHYFVDVFGHPAAKPQTLREILQREQVEPDQVMVIGDGQSDCDAAKEIGTHLFHIPTDGTLLDFFASFRELHFY